MAFKPSKYQVAIDEEYTTTQNNLVINSVAGSGKTTTLLSLLNKTYVKSTFLAFNKSIADEIAEKVGYNPAVEVMTLHSLGMRSLIKHFNRHLKLKNNKLWDIIKPFESSWKIPRKKYVPTVLRLQRLVDIYRLTLCEGIDDLERVADDMGVDYQQDDLFKVIDIIYAYEQYNKNPEFIDFTDMIYLVATNPDVKMAINPKIIFVDECQDLNACQHALVDRLISENNARFVACGDPYQCQPAGTKVMLWDGTEKNIEEIEVGDSVVSYDSLNRMGFVGRFEEEWQRDRYSDTKIQEISSHQYTGNLFTVSTPQFRSKYTSNHRCMVKYKDSDSYAVYLMRKDDLWRIGIVKFWNKVGELGVNQRLIQERGDAIWVLDVYDNRFDAYKQEQFLSIKHNIPQQRFFDNKCGLWTQESLNDFWNQCRIELDMQSRAEILLTSFKRDVQYPLCTKEESKRRARNQFIECRACNLIPEVMFIGVFNEQNSIEVGYRKGKILKPIDTEFTLEVTQESVEVFSLSVSKREMYVADRILTHNSVYGFAGAHSRSFDIFKEKENVVEMPLSICYRCPTSVIKEANEVYNIMESSPSAEIGIVDRGGWEDIIEGDMVICRNVKPLIKLYFYLIGRGLKVMIRGKDLGVGLINLIKPFANQTTRSAQDQFASMLLNKYEELKDRDIDNPKSHPSYVNLEEKIEVISEIGKKFYTINEMIIFLEKMFGDDNRDGVILSTIHKSKGLESDRVFFLDSNLIPSKFAVTEDQLIQESNLRYVAITRAKEELYYIYSQ